MRSSSPEGRGEPLGKKTDLGKKHTKIILVKEGRFVVAAGIVVKRTTLPVGTDDYLSILLSTRRVNLMVRPQETDRESAVVRKSGPTF